MPARIVDCSFAINNAACKPLPATSPITKLTLIGGIIRGSYLTQEAVFLSGSVYPSSFAYWFVDPDNLISIQKNIHVKGDVNLMVILNSI